MILLLAVRGSVVRFGEKNGWPTPHNFGPVLTPPLEPFRRRKRAMGAPPAIKRRTIIQSRG
jgi:hypothetical protein